MLIKVMCGFIGYITNKNNSKNKELEKKLNKYLFFLNNRGPDFQEEKKINDYNNNIHVGFSRLAIQDLNSEANKIFYYKDKMLLFNGEIYNFIELKNKYFINEKFETSTDTELLFKMFEKYGPKKINECKGIFSIVFFDFKSKDIFLIRDYTGTKPLYYFKDKNYFAFSSEAWFLYSLSNKEINKNTLNFFLNFGFTCENNTLIRDVKKIIPRKIYKFNFENKKLETEDYFNINEKKINKPPVQEELNFTIENIVKSNLISDTKIGTFLSGGIDSTTITLLAKKYNKNVESFTTYYLPNEKYKKFNIDFNYAKKVSEQFGIKLNTHFVKNDSDLLNDLLNITDYLDEPVSNLNFLNTYWQTKLAKEKGFKVILTGDGADELFCGYDRYQRLFLAQKLRLFGFLSDKIKDYNNLSTDNLPLWFYTIFKNEGIHKILKDKNFYENLPPNNFFENIKFDNNVDYINYFDFRYWLTNESNFKLDKCSMINSVEARVPFQDIELIKNLFFVSNKSKFSFFNRKFNLKKNNFIPNYIKRRAKTGWFSPEKIFLDINLNKIRNIFFQEKKINQQGIFDYSELDNLFNSYKFKGYLIKRILITIILFQIWYDKILSLD